MKEFAMPFRPAPCDAIVVNCSDHDFRTEFEIFIRMHLRIRHPHQISLPGGLLDVGIDPGQPGATTLVDKITCILSHVERPNRLVIIGHSGCKWAKHVGLAGEAYPTAMANAVQTLRDTLPLDQISLEHYVARVEGERIHFEEVK